MATHDTPRDAPSRDGDAARPRGRPRDPQVEQRIRRAALEQLAQGGLANLSVDRICSAAGVPRSTFYRRWPHLTDLLLDAFNDAARLELPPETGDLRRSQLAQDNLEVGIGIHGDRP